MSEETNSIIPPQSMGSVSKPQTKSEVQAGLTVDIAAVSKLDRALQAAKTTLKGLKEEMQGLAKASKDVATPGQGAAKSQNGTPQFNNTSPGFGWGRRGGGVGGGQGGSSQSPSSPGGGGGNQQSGYAGLSPGQRTGLAVAATGYAGMKGLNAIDARLDGNRAYSISADRLSVDMQQRYGGSQNEITNQYRRPLQEYRLGANGINEMLGYQTRTGIDAGAAGVDAIRTQSGFTLGTQDVLGIYQQNLDPARANRQFMMMGGMSAYGPNGEPVDQNELMTQRMKMFQLDDRSINKGAIRQGSISRHRMTIAGISSEEQDLLIQRGQNQATFREAGGKGNYDAGNDAHQKIMGIDDNFATKAEESERVRVDREEDMYSRQADNYASMEDSNAELVGALNSLEETFSGIFGTRASTRPYQKVLGKVLGAAIPGAGFALGKLGGGDPPDGPGGGTSAAPAGVSSNSSSVNDATIKIPVGYNGGRKTLNEVKQRSDFQKMHPKMQQRMLSMFRENPNLGIGGGYRSSQAQEEMFLSRHEPTSEDTGIKWQGKFWKRVRGAAAAPPGRSMHEIGLAADLVGDLDWMNANASRFGLKHFAGVNNEPWHVQPVELPNSRAKYEAGGASWGTNGDFDEDAVFTDTPGTSGEEDAAHAGGGGLGMDGDFTGLSISEIVDAYVNGGGFGEGSRESSQPGNSSGGDSTAATAVAFNGTVGSGSKAAAEAAFKAGFRGQNLADIVAIAGRESGWDPTAINRSSDDTGMWQIAPVNFGKYSQQQLLNVDNNAAVARRLFEGGGWQGWTATDSRHKVNGVWKVDPSGKGGPGWAQDGDHMWHTEKFRGEAAAAATSVENSSGDPTDAVVHTPRAPRPQRSAPAITNGGSGGVSMNNTYQIEFSPVINFAGSAPTDVRAMATEVESLLKESMNRALERSA